MGCVVDVFDCAEEGSCVEFCVVILESVDDSVAERVDTQLLRESIQLEQATTILFIPRRQDPLLPL